MAEELENSGVESDSTPHTVFVLGAGASYEVGLPVGAQLKDQIAKLVNIKFSDVGSGEHTGDAWVMEAFRAHARAESLNVNELLHAGWHISDAMPQAISIDNFLDARRGEKLIELAGKLGIVQGILHAERNSKIFIDPRSQSNRIKFTNVTNTWFNKFFQLVTENCRFEDVVERLKSVSIISFNYDRCLAHFLLHSLQNYYGVSTQEAEEVLRDFEVLYPYGTVGPLPFAAAQKGVTYGATLNGAGLLEHSREILTFTEGTDQRFSEITRIRNNIKNAKRIVFLGFAFHPLNMELLAPKPETISPRNQIVIGTAYGLSISDLEAIREDLDIRLHKPTKIVLPGETCDGLFSNNSRTLSMVRT